MCACQAPLRLDGVEKQGKQPVQRFDAYQVAAQIDKRTLAVLGNNGVVLEYDLGKSGEPKRFTVGAERGFDTPSFMAATRCPSGRFFALAFDGGVWERQSAGEWRENKIDTTESVQDIACTADDTLWVSASFTTLFKSVDHGKNWTETSRDEDAAFTQLSFPDPMIGFAVGEFGFLLKTVNNGQSWTQVRGISEDFYPLSTRFISSEEGWIGGLQGAIYHTLDGAQSWQKENADSIAPIYNIVETNSGMMAVGNFGTVLRRQANGHWVGVGQDTIKSRGYLRALAVVGKSNPQVFIAGQGYSVQTSLSKLNSGG